MGGGIGQGVVRAERDAGHVDAVGVDGEPFQERVTNGPHVVGVQRMPPSGPRPLFPPHLS